MSKRSLGTLTLDLVARTGGFVQGMDKAERQSEKWRKQVENDLKTIGNTMAGASVAAVAGLTAITASTIRTSKELTRLSQVAGTSTTEFQKYAAGAKAVGIEQDKLADIFKDMSDRVGDFLQTGGGPLADFFEQIAPKVGVTAEQFRNLSGPDALGLFTSSLEKANLSQNEMVFYLEAMASDASMLLPLLKDNAEGFKLFASEAEKAGAILDKDTIKSAKEMQAAMFLLEQSALGMKNQISSALVPVLADLSEEFTEVAADGAIAEDVGNALAGALKGVAATAVGAFASIQLMGKALAGFGGALNSAAEDAEWWEKLSPIAMVNHIRENWGKAEGILDASAEDLEETITRYGNLLSGIWEAGSGDGTGGDDAETRVKRLAAIWKEFEESVAGGIGAGSGGSGGGGTGGNGELEKQLQQRLETIRQSFETEKQTILRVYGERNEEIQALYEADAISKMEADNLKFQNEQQKIESITALTKENLAEREEAEAGYWERWIESASDNLQNFDELSKTVIDNFTTGFGNAFESMIFDAESLDDALKGIGETILRSVVNAIGQMSAQWLALQAVQAVVGSSATAATVGQAAIASSAWAPAAAMASLATMGGNAVPAATALTTTTTLASGLALTGMAHDGIDTVPQEGTWLLDKGERVMSSPQADKLDQFLASRNLGGGGDAPIINVTEAPGQGGAIEPRQNQDGQWVVDIMVEQFSTHGPGSKAAQTAFGLRRQGY